MRIKCDESCKKVVHVINPTVTKMNDGIQRIGLVCPECQHEYVSYYTNAEIRGMQYKMRKKRPGPAADKYKSQIESKMKELRRVIEGGAELPQANAFGDSDSDQVESISDGTEEQQDASSV